MSFLLQIEMANRKGVEIPHGWGVDSTGQVRVTFVQDRFTSAQLLSAFSEVKILVTSRLLLEQKWLAGGRGMGEAEVRSAFGDRLL